MGESPVVADKTKLILEVEYEGKRYKYKNVIHDAAELEYLELRTNGLLKTDLARNFLNDEFIAVL